MRFKIIGLFILVFFISANWMSEGYIIGKTQSKESTKEEKAIRLESICFNHNEADNSGADAINIRKNFNEPVNIPEWVKGSVKGDPVTYIKGMKNVEIKAVFSADKNVKSAEIGATQKEGKLGDLESKKVDFNNNPFVEVPFEIDIPDEIDSFDQVWEWKYDNIVINGRTASDLEGQADNNTSTNHIYIIFSFNEPKSLSPWYKTKETQPWVDVLDKVFKWTGVNGATDSKVVAKAITKHLFRNIGARFSYEPSYTSLRERNFDLEKFMDAMGEGSNGNVGNVNCYDMAKALVTFANIVGCNLEYVESNRPFGKLNALNPIGREQNYMKNQFSFFVHSFAWINKGEGGCYDATFGKDTQNPVTEKNWNAYKEVILKKGEPEPGFADLYCDFSIGTIDWGVSCLSLPPPIRKAMEKYESDSWPKYIRKKISDQKTGQILNNISKIKKPINLSQSEKMWGDDGLNTKENITDIEYSVAYQNWKEKEKEKENGWRLSAKVVKGNSMEEIKKYLIYRYTNWSNEPYQIKIIKRLYKKKWDGNGFIGFKIEENEGEGTGALHIDFIRHNVLIMLQAEGTTKNKLLKFAKEVDVSLIPLFEEDKNIAQTPPEPGTFPFYINKKEHRKRGGRKVIVQVKKRGAVESRFFKILKRKNKKPIYFQEDELIRIFPAYDKKKFKDGKKFWPADYYLIFPSTWEYCDAVERSKPPQPCHDAVEQTEQIPSPCNDSPINGKFKLIFHAPKDFPPPVPIPININNNGEILLVICGGMPPIWWVEIIPPFIPFIPFIHPIIPLELILKAAIEALASSGNVEVGDDHQPR